MTGTINYFSYRKKIMFFLMQNIFVIPTIAAMQTSIGTREAWKLGELTYRAGERFVNTMVN